MHKISDEFEFRPDQTTDYGVSCPWASKNSHRLIRGKWYLYASLFIFERIIIKLAGNQAGIKARSNSILGRIRPLILESLAPEWRKFELEYLWIQLANLDQILCVTSLGRGKGCIGFRGRLTLAHWTQVSDRCPLGYLFLFIVHTHEHELTMIRTIISIMTSFCRLK